MVVERERGSRFWRIVPRRKIGSWGMTVRRSRRMFRGIVEMSMLSMRIVPSWISSMWKRSATKEDLPDPEGPQIPIFCPAGIVKLMS